MPFNRSTAVVVVSHSPRPQNFRKNPFTAHTHTHKFRREHTLAHTRTRKHTHTHALDEIINNLFISSFRAARTFAHRLETNRTNICVCVRVCARIEFISIRRKLCACVERAQASACTHTQWAHVHEQIKFSTNHRHRVESKSHSYSRTCA